jgi:hypothetical protein
MLVGVVEDPRSTISPRLSLAILDLPAPVLRRQATPIVSAGQCGEPAVSESKEALRYSRSRIRSDSISPVFVSK